MIVSIGGDYSPRKFDHFATNNTSKFFTNTIIIEGNEEGSENKTPE